MKLDSQAAVLRESESEAVLVSQAAVLQVFAMVLLLKRNAAPPSPSARTLPAQTSETPAEICDCHCGGSEIPAQLCDGEPP